MKIEKEKIENFFDFVMDEGLTIEEILHLTKTYCIDYRDDILQSQENKSSVSLAIRFIDEAKKLIKKSNEV